MPHPTMPHAVRDFIELDKKAKTVKISYRTAADYMILQYMEVKRNDLKVFSLELGDNMPTLWGFRIRRNFDVEVIQAGAYDVYPPKYEATATASLFPELKSTEQSYAIATALFVQKVAEKHKFRTDGWLLCKLTPSLYNFLTADDK